MASISGGNITVSVVLHTERHAHLVRFVREWQAKNPAGLSALFRAALECYIERQEAVSRQGPVTVEEIEAAVRRAVEAALQGRVVEAPAEDDPGLMTISSGTETAVQLAKMRETLDQWGEEG